MKKESLNFMDCDISIHVYKTTILTVEHDTGVNIRALLVVLRELRPLKHNILSTVSPSNSIQTDPITRFPIQPPGDGVVTLDVSVDRIRLQDIMKDHQGKVWLSCHLLILKVIRVFFSDMFKVRHLYCNIKQWSHHRHDPWEQVHFFLPCLQGRVSAQKKKNWAGDF